MHSGTTTMAIIDVNATDKIQRLDERTRGVSSASFEANDDHLSDLACTQTFRFCRRKRLRLVAICAWLSREMRNTMNGYSEASLPATCVVLCRLATPESWIDMEVIFGKLLLQLAKIFGEDCTRSRKRKK